MGWKRRETERRGSCKGACKQPLVFLSTISARGEGEGRGYPTVNVDTSISIISISNAIDYLTKSNKGGLFQGKGGRGL